MPKRTRSEMSTDAKRRMAIAIAARERAKFPYSKFGTAHYPRGSDDSLRMFGPTFKTANEGQKGNRKYFGFIGRGRYGVRNFVGDMRTLGLNKYTNALGDIALGAVRSATDAGMGAAVRKITGRGSYGTNLGSNDLFSANDKDDIIISHSEFLTSITPTNTGFQTQFSCVLNPGLKSFAPMLAQIAQFYEEYEFEQLVFEFRSTVVEGNDNAAGTLLMATQYNPTNPLFLDEVSMDNYSHSCATRVTDSLLHGVECEERATGQARFEYVRTGDVPVGQDPKTYDLAVFQVATQGATANLQLGRLYVHYKVKLSKLKLVPVTPLNSLIWASRRTAGTSITTSALFGTSGSEAFYQTNAPDNIFIQDNAIIFPSSLPAGRYQISVQVFIPTASGITKTAPTTTNCTLVQDSDGGPSAFSMVAPQGSTSGQNHLVSYVLDIPGAQTSTLSFAWTMPTGASGTQVTTVVAQVPSNLELPNAI